MYDKIEVEGKHCSWGRNEPMRSSLFLKKLSYNLSAAIFRYCWNMCCKIRTEDCDNDMMMEVVVLTIMMMFTCPAPGQ